MAVIGAENHERIFGDSQLIQPVHNAPDLPVHQAHHAVIDGHIFAQRGPLMQMAMEAVIAIRRLPPGREVRLSLLCFGELGRHRLQLARLQRARLHRLGIVHRRPRFGNQVGRVRIVETAPEEERPVGLDAALYGRNRALGGPYGVVVRLRQLPGMFPPGRVGIGRPRLEKVPPVGQAVLLHPDAIMLPRVRLIGVIARHLYMLKAIPRPAELPPERQVAQGRLTFQRCLLRARGQRLKMGFADQGRVVAVLMQRITDCRHIFAQLHANRPAAMPGRILAGNDRRPRGRADRIVAIGPVEAGAFPRQPVQRRRLDSGIGHAEGRKMLLIARNQQDIGWSSHRKSSLDPDMKCEPRSRRMVPHILSHAARAR